MPPFTFKNTLLCLLGTCLLSVQLSAKDKTKKNSQYEQANIMQKAWGDLTTRNNMYFNANEIYKDILKRHEDSREIDFYSTYPFYFHDNADFSNYESELQTITKKTGIVLQLHDYSRWRDNAFLLLGKAQYLQQKYDTSLITFQYIVTTMKPGKMSNKVAISNKERMKYLRKREKEIAKKAGEKQKILDIKWKEEQKENEEKVEDAREKQEAAIEKKKKEIEEIIAAKKKVIELQKKGKKIPPELLAKAKGKTKQDTTEVIIPVKTPEKKLDFDPNLPYVLLNDEYVKNPYYVDTSNRNNDMPLNELLSKKEEAAWDKLTFWEKIKHKASRPEAIIWMSKALAETGNYADAQGIIAYGKALRKLTAKQRKDLHLADAYLQIKRNNIPVAIEKLENSMLLIKKKQERAHYEFILAQLYNLNSQPADASDYFEKVVKNTNDEIMNFYAQLFLIKLYTQYPELTNDDVKKTLVKLLNKGKNNGRADEVYYAVATYHYNKKDTVKASEFLHKSIDASVSADTWQKGFSFLKLAQIHYDQEEYALAKSDYDSVITFLPQEDPEFPEAQLRQSVLSELAANFQTIRDQDSLQVLGRMKPEALEKYLANLQSIEDKSDKKKNRFSTEDAGSNPGILVIVPNSNIQYSSNGLWYFYNPDIKASGFNSFRTVWGDRALKENWRRSIKSTFDQLDVATIVETTDKVAVLDSVITDPNMMIPKTPEDFIASDMLIANALFGSGEIFKNQLKNIPKSKQMFDELIRRFPNSENDAIAHYYEYLILKEQNLTGLAGKEKQYILDNYPMSDIAGKIRAMDDTTQRIPLGNQETAAGLYASTYQLFQNGQYDKVIQNKSQAALKYPNTPEMQQFEFLEALSYGKQKNLPLYKTMLSNIVMKYPSGEIKEKAQQYLIALLEMEDKKKDPVQEKTIPADSLTGEKILDFVVDTSDFWVALTLDDPYFQLQKVVTMLEKFSASNAPNQKVKVNPVFLQGNQTVITLKRFEYQQDAAIFLDKLLDSKFGIFGEKATVVFGYVIAPVNFKKLKSFEDFPVYEKYYLDNYPQ